MPLTQGQILNNRYRIEGLLGQGGFGAVYKAWDLNMERWRALKENLDTSPEAQRQFKREAQIVGDLAHPNLPRVIDHFIVPDPSGGCGSAYLVMDYVEGEDLGKKLLQRNGEPFPEGQVLGWLGQVCDALEFLHGQQPPVIHRDIKPSNIKITPAGKAVLVDFGIAKLYDPNLRTTVGAKAVTPGYSPPEQYGRGATDAQSDIYALGATAYHLLTGQTPPDSMEFISGGSAPLRPAREINQAISPQVSAAIEHAMQLNRANRWKSVAEFKQALRPSPPLPILREGTEVEGVGEVVHLVQPPARTLVVETVTPDNKTQRRPWLWVVGLGGLALAGIVMIGLVVWGLPSLFGGGRTTPTPRSSQSALASPVQPTDIAGIEQAATPTEVKGPTALAANLTQLIADARAEGTLSTIALPHNWCNYGEVISSFRSKYGIQVNELMPDGTSSAEIESIKANKTSKGLQAPDVIDVGFGFGPQLLSDGIVQPYQVATWQTIPDAAKDPNGMWYGDYYGAMGFEVNLDLVQNPPKTWADLLKPEYKGQVALPGDPRGGSNQAILAVQAAAIASGGSWEDSTSGLQFFKKLNEAGNFVPMIGGQSTLVNGETPILLRWDYNALADKVSMAGNTNIEFYLPEGTPPLAGVYIQAISAYAPHPNAAKLWMEFLYSDEGQLLWLKGACHPIRYNDLLRRGVIPPALAANLPPAVGYANAIFPTVDQLATSKTFIAKNWDAIVGVNIK